MSERPEKPSLEELLDEHDTVAAVEERLEELRPPLPDRFEGMTKEDILDLPAHRGTDEEARQVVEWLMYDRWASVVLAEAEERKPAQ